MMKQATSTSKSPRQSEHVTQRDSLAGQDAVSLAPPEYGIDFADREASEDTLPQESPYTGDTERVSSNAYDTAGLMPGLEEDEEGALVGGRTIRITRAVMDSAYSYSASESVILGS